MVSDRSQNAFFYCTLVGLKSTEILSGWSKTVDNERGAAVQVYPVIRTRGASIELESFRNKLRSISRIITPLPPRVVHATNECFSGDCPRLANILLYYAPVDAQGRLES